MPTEQTALSRKDFSGNCMSILHLLRTHPLAPLSSALIVLLGLLGGLLYWHYSQTNAQTERAIYGQSLASSAAQRAVSPTLNQDLISLQVILQELDQYPHVIGATIHDVENQLLVQSGYSPGERAQREHQTYSAAIALHNNVAGYLRVAVQAPQLTGGGRQFFVFWTLAVLVAATLPWLTRFPFQLPGQGHGGAIESDQPPEEPSLAVEPSVNLRLNLELLNLPLLYQQLNLESFTQLVERFDYQLKGVLTLYTGKRRLLNEHRMLIDFEGADTADCALRALCSAQLLKQLSDANSGPKLRLSARIQPLPEAETESLAQEFVVQQSLGPDRHQTGVFIAPELVDDSLSQHLELDVATGRLLEIKSPYKALLDKQQQQLQTHSNPDRRAKPV